MYFDVSPDDCSLLRTISGSSRQEAAFKRERSPFAMVLSAGARTLGLSKGWKERSRIAFISAAAALAGLACWGCGSPRDQLLLLP